MKNIVKMISVNDGKEVNDHDGDFLAVDHYPRTEAIIAAFLNDGYTLINQTQRVTPAIQKAGSYSFYMGGWDLLFIKQIEDDAEDDSDEFLKRVIDDSIHLAADDDCYEEYDLNYVEMDEE